MQFSFRVIFLIYFISTCSIQAIGQTEKERKLAENALSYSSQTITVLDSLSHFCEKFRTLNANIEQPDFKPLYAEMKIVDKHIKKGVKICKKLMTQMSKRDGTFTKKEFNAFEEIYLYERGQEDFYECYESVMNAEEDEFEKGMSSLLSRLSKTKEYIKDYQGVLTKLLAND